MKRVAIVGAGVSGLTCAQLLKDRYAVTVFEREQKPGGLIRCERVEGSLFHICGGHVFNTKNQQVLDWFWSKFDRDEQFVKTDRRSAVCMGDGTFVDYPIENHVYQMDVDIQKAFVGDLLEMKKESCKPDNFDDFLRSRFGKTLYNLYFRPYNEKVWRRDLREVPLDWLAGKLPMPTVEEMILANMNHFEERSFVHSSFYYGKEGGSQLIADVLAKDVDVVYGVDIDDLTFGGRYDKVIFCGNIKDVPRIAKGIELGDCVAEIETLEYHGTTAVFCEFDKNPYSWFYQPSPDHESHRFICTGNFSPSNNAPGKMTGTIEFTDHIDVDGINEQLEKMPFHPRYLTHHYSKYTYPIQHKNTRSLIKTVKGILEHHGLYLCGRFAEWEYYNMDAAMASAMDLSRGL